MTTSFYEPPALEIGLTLGLGLTLLSPYYRRFAHILNLHGDERVLDFGAGSGICTRHIAARLQKGGRLDCVDISHDWMRVIRKTLRRFDNVSYHLAHITQVGLPETTFDVIVMHFVLHDIPRVDRAPVMQVLARKLKPQGRLILREPQGHGLSQDELIQLTQAAGLQITTLTSHKVAAGPVYDGRFTR
jgi:ubiquinone/menaquinone biosynthesis C-methylase UbiE